MTSRALIPSPTHPPTYLPTYLFPGRINAMASHVDGWLIYLVTYAQVAVFVPLQLLYRGHQKTSFQSFSVP